MSADRILHILADRYRSDARRFRELGQVPPAELLERVAVELEDEREAHESEPLTISEAAEASGFSSSHLYHLLQAGQLPNAGEKNAPRIRRGDLPRKGTRIQDGSQEGGPDLADEIIEARGLDFARNRPRRPRIEKGKRPVRQRSRTR